MVIDLDEAIPCPHCAREVFPEPIKGLLACPICRGVIKPRLLQLAHDHDEED
jgi:hypothetical protein